MAEGKRIKNARCCCGCCGPRAGESGWMTLSIIANRELSSSGPVVCSLIGDWPMVQNSDDDQWCWGSNCGQHSGFPDCLTDWANPCCWYPGGDCEKGQAGTCQGAFDEYGYNFSFGCSCAFLSGPGTRLAIDRYCNDTSVAENLLQEGAFPSIAATEVTCSPYSARFEFSIPSVFGPCCEDVPLIGIVTPGQLVKPSSSSG
jgi:hypothetical protein